MEIHPITDADLKSVAQVHMLAFPDAALTQFGAEAVRSYYAWQLDGARDCSCIGAFVDTQLAGYCFGGVFRSSEAGFFLKNLYYLGWSVITHPRLLTNEMVKFRIKEMVQDIKRYLVPKQKPIELPPPVIRKFGILSLAIHPQYQRLGIGKLLMQDVEASAHQKGFNSMRLSVHPFNYKAVLFYEKLGWRKISSADGSWMGFMMKDLGNGDE
jgi:ribosomal protein S18 acetylase RimI-like enzyme